MKRPGVNLGLPALVAIALSVMNALGDDGVVRLRAVQRPFLVTIFTAPELLQGTPAEMNVLVQGLDSNDPILDADLNLTFTPPGVSAAGATEQFCDGTGMAGMGSNSVPFTVAATHRHSSNKLFYAAAVNFVAAGHWRLQVSIKHEGESVKMDCLLPVSPPPHELVGLIPYLCLPPLLVGLFALNQRLRLRENLPLAVKTASVH